MEWLTHQLARVFDRTLSYSDAQRLAQWCNQAAVGKGVHLSTVARLDHELELRGHWGRHPQVPIEAGEPAGARLELRIQRAA